MPRKVPHTNTWTPVEPDFEAFNHGEDVQPPNGIFEFGRRYDVHDEFIPFSGRTYDPLERIENLREYMAGLPKNAAGFTMPDLARAGMFNGNAQSLSGIESKIFHLCGSRQYDREAHKNRKRYANPTYVHLHAVEAIEGDDERREQLRNLAHLGVLSLENELLPPHFGVESTDELQRIADELPAFDFKSERYHGKRKIARTWKVTNKWGTPTARIASAFDMNQQRVARWIQAYADDFVVPDDPTKGGWRREIEQALELRDELGLDQ